MAATTNAAPTVDIPQAPGAAPVEMIPGTNLQVPVGSGVESLLPVAAPFKSEAPPWYTPPGTIWSRLGCAVPQPGEQIQTNNGVIYDFVNEAQKQLFQTLWAPATGIDRLTDGWPQYDTLWKIHQLLINGRNRLVAKTTPDAGSPLRPIKGAPAPKMFLVYPVPLYGPLGCVNQYLRELTELILIMCSEAMQHTDNMKAFYVSTDFFKAVYPTIKYLIADLATKFFGEDPAIFQTPAGDSYVVPTAKWTAFTRLNSPDTEATTELPPLSITCPTASDLQRIRGLTIEQAVPFLQPWPDAQYQMSSGGVWGNSSSPAADAAARAAASGAQPNLAATADPSIFATNGPPRA